MDPGKATFRAPSRGWPDRGGGVGWPSGSGVREGAPESQERWGGFWPPGCGSDLLGDRELSLCEGLQFASGDKGTGTPSQEW